MTRKTNKLDFARIGELHMFSLVVAKAAAAGHENHHRRRGAIDKQRITEAPESMVLVLRPSIAALFKIICWRLSSKVQGGISNQRATSNLQPCRSASNLIAT
ncbi:hypothetical protein [Pseudorhizobium marinum]|uniref:hypothetical protein n=1 Tax=Pseudorhizobium marinum TaxID=1496690 RepID=UPI000496F5BD|nr:hypothetical protein [Pseudorhizobium marinum]